MRTWEETRYTPGAALLPSTPSVVGALLGGDTPASALETLCSRQPLEEQLHPQLVLMTLTHALQSVRRGRGDVPLRRTAFPCRCHPLPSTCRAGGCCVQEAAPAGTPPGQTAWLSLGAPGLGPPLWHCYRSFQHLEITLVAGGTPRPLRTQNSDVLVSVCQVFAEQNA